jgi:hypothetical protein
LREKKTPERFEKGLLMPDAYIYDAVGRPRGRGNPEG